MNSSCLSRSSDPPTKADDARKILLFVIMAVCEHCGSFAPLSRKQTNFVAFVKQKSVCTDLVYNKQVGV